LRPCVSGIGCGGRSSGCSDPCCCLASFAVGKPVLIEETFPLACSPKELEQFIERSKKHAAGWIGFYWGKPPEELRRSKTIPDALTLGWLELFHKKATEMGK
jgi:hypothetical protein